MTHQSFISSEVSRKRYWARSVAGYPVLHKAKPNSAHLALTSIQKTTGSLEIITQNVDRLHQVSGAEGVLDLHGRIDWVQCLSCGFILTRLKMQDLLLEANPHLAAPLAASSSSLRPDGDADVAEADYAQVAA